MLRVSRTEINNQIYDNCASENIKIYPKPSNKNQVLFKKHFVTDPGGGHGICLILPTRGEPTMRSATTSAYHRVCLLQGGSGEGVGINGTVW